MLFGHGHHEVVFCDLGVLVEVKVLLHQYLDIKRGERKSSDVVRRNVKRC